MKYDLDYYDNMLRMYSATAEPICRIRWDWVSEISPRTVLDYGSGIGWFRAFRPEGVEVDTFDVMPTLQTGLLHSEYDLVTYWDVIEHMPHWNPCWIPAKHIALTTPILPEGQNPATWKHSKDGEHVIVFTPEHLEVLFSEYDYRLVKHGMPECPPRTDIHSFLFRRV